MSLRWSTPCDYEGHVCPYMDNDGNVNCEWWCIAVEPEDCPEEIEYLAFDEPEDWAEKEAPEI